MTLRRRRKPQASTTDRGYGHEHRKLRAAWALRVATGTEPCRRCGRLIAPDAMPCPRCGKPTSPGGKASRGRCGWDLGHNDFDRTQYTGPEHACCNRGTAAHRRRRDASIARKAQGLLKRTSRDW